MRGWMNAAIPSFSAAPYVWIWGRMDLGRTTQLSVQQPLRRAHPSLPSWCLWVFAAVSQLGVLDFCSRAWRLT